jgi:hypothetical protein
MLSKEQIGRYLLPKVQPLAEKSLIGYNGEYEVKTVDAELLLRTTEDHSHADAK